MTLDANSIRKACKTNSVTKAELDTLASVTPGAAAASKALVLDSSGDVSGIGAIGVESLTLSSPRWEDLRVPVSSTKVGGNDPGYAKFRDNGSGSRGVFTYLFDKASDEELFFVAQLPHDWKEGTDINAHVHWAPIDTDTGTICWALEYTWTNMEAVWGTSVIVAGTPVAAPGVAYQHTRYEIATLSGTGKTISSMLVCRVFRDVSADSYDNDAALFEIDFHYQVDTPGGSTTAMAK